MTGEANQLAAQMVIAASKHLDALIQAANDGDKQAAEELHRHITAEIEFGGALDDRLTAYVIDHELPRKSKKVDNGTRDLGLAFAVALMIERGETREWAITNVAAAANLSWKSVERVFHREARAIAKEWLGTSEAGPVSNDEPLTDKQKKRAFMVALASPYLPKPLPRGLGTRRN